MRVIPVMDLQGGLAVHAVKGERERYRPVNSSLVAGGDPVALAQAFRQRFGLRELYVADLDAIQGRGQHEAVIAGLAGQPDLTVMVDAGVATAEQAGHVLRLGVQKIIVGTETLAGWSALAAIQAIVAAERLVISLDMRAERVLAGSQELAGLTPLELLDRLVEAGCREVILLDLARVGTAAGAGQSLLAAAHSRHAELVLLAGGGVRHLADLEALQSAGAAGALVATALHSGALAYQDITRLALS